VVPGGKGEGKGILTVIEREGKERTISRFVV
jgi:hypothetical protein